VAERIAIETALSPGVTEREIIRTVLYFDVFNYPLTRRELFENSPVVTDEATFQNTTDLLVAERLLKERNGYIMSPLADDSIVTRRETGNAGARRMMPVAAEYSRKIASFPFVEGVFLSGGLSKKYFAENSDIDYFIVTRPGRLWICRTLLILRYKMLPREKKKLWCVNYFVTSDSLRIPDVNRFTATEIAHLIPAVNFQLYEKMMAANAWFRDVLPNKQLFTASLLNGQPRRGIFSRLVAALLGGAVGALTDRMLLTLTRRRWKRKFPLLSPEEFEVRLRSRRDVCKRHTLGFQQIVLDSWKSRQADFESRFSISL
jgi:hypothetical protein